MLDEMTQGMLKIVLEKEETPEFLYDPDLELQGEISLNQNKWQGLFKGLDKPDHSGGNPDLELEIEGVKCDYKHERDLDRNYFATEAAVIIQKWARGWFVRNEKRKLLKQASSLKLQKLARGYLAKCRLYHLSNAKALITVSRITRSTLAQHHILYLREARLAKVTQRWYRGKRDRRIAHDLAIKRACFRVALRFRGNEGMIAM